MNCMHLKTGTAKAACGEDVPFQMRMYRKTELACLYFPYTDKKGALMNLWRWIKRCTPLDQALQEAGYDKYRKYFLKREVELIVKFLGEP